MTSHSDLQDACRELGALLETLDATEIRNGKAAAGLFVKDNLLADADRVIKLRHTPPTTRPPWNAAVANALLDAHELIRRTEASLRQQVTGQGSGVFRECPHLS